MRGDWFAALVPFGYQNFLLACDGGDLPKVWGGDGKRRLSVLSSPNLQARNAITFTQYSQPACGVRAGDEVKPGDAENLRWEIQ